MSDGRTSDMIRWTFTIDPARSGEVEGYLADLGPEVYTHGEGRFTVLWEEPEGDLGEVVEALWEVHGGPFEVTHEEFRREGYSVYHADEEAATEVA